VSPAVTLALTLVVSAVALTALFWGLALVAQGYLYGQPADRLPLRAVVAGLACGLFLTVWTYANTRASHEDKYGTVFTFTPTGTKEVSEFDAVRRYGKTEGKTTTWLLDEKGQPKETTTKYTWQTEGRGGRFVEAGTGKEFKLNDASSMTVALLVPEDGKATRFDAQVKDGVYTAKKNEVVFEEQGGSRTIKGADPRQMEIPSSSAFALAVLLNVGHFVVWFLAFWLVLRFNAGHAVLFVLVLGSVAMLVVMPLVFQLNTPKPVPLIVQQQQPAPGTGK
jgi:hypothetical protein